MLKQRLSHKLLQKLSPQQIQLMKLLQVPTAALESRVKEELEANPALQEGADENEKDDLLSTIEEKKEEPEAETKEKNDEVDLSDYLSEDNFTDTSYSDSGYSSYNADDDDKTMPVEMSRSFHEHLQSQLGLLRLDDRKHIIAEQIIGSVGEDGYLRREIDAIVNDLAFSQNVMTSEEEVLELLLKVQNFEPAGIAARDLQECLLIQLRKEYEAEDREDVALAVNILTNAFEAFSKKHYTKLQSKFNITTEQLKGAVEEILKLNPKPASAYSGGKTVNNYVIPDFIIKNEDGDLKLTLNSRNAPDLRVNNNFMDMMKDYKKTKKKSKEQKNAIMFIKQKLDSAKWFIDAIKQRQHTLLSTMSTIMEFQKEFFLTGDEMTLRPMILKDIADVTGLDISTVSRVANSKYVLTEFGTLSLKFFFSESIQTQDGEEASTREVKRVLQNIIAKEDKKKPLSDQKLMEMLKQEGYNIARRTVAKYREQLNIPVARLRKEI